MLVFEKENVINLALDKNVIHVVFQDACTEDDIEDIYEYFGTEAFDFDENTQIIFDFTYSYFKDNNFLKLFIELLETYSFSKEYISGLKSLSNMILSKIKKSLDDKSREIFYMVII